MLQNFTDANASLDVAVEHKADKVDTSLAKDIRHAEIVIHDFVNGVKRILFVDDGVE